MSTRQNKLGCLDVLNVCLKYVEPYSLANFFLINNLSHKLRFTYDVRFWRINCDHLNRILCIFSNAIIIGLNLNYTFCDGFMQCENVVHLEIDGMYRNKMDQIVCSELTKQIMEQYVNVTSIVVRNCIIREHNIFRICKKLKDVCFSNCKYDGRMSDIIRGLTLRKIKMDVNEDNKIIEFFSECRELKELDINCWFSSTKCALRCEKLRMLRCISNFNCMHFFNFDCINLRKIVLRLHKIVLRRIGNLDCVSRCKRLKFLDIYFRDELDLSVLKNLRIHHLIVAYCINLKVLGGCKDLRYLDVRGCYNITNWEILFEAPKLRTVIASLWYPIFDVLREKGVRVYCRL